MIDGNGGDDIIDAGLGDDTVDGGGDDDLIDGNDGDDLLAGGVGTDTITGGEGDDTIDGGAGDDDIAVGGNDVAEGGNGDDVFTIDPSDTGPVQAQIDGGSDATDGNPDDLANGNAGDILDLSDRPEDLDVTFGTDPESGIVDGLDGDSLPDVIFDEIEKVETGSGDDVIDGTGSNGPIDVAGNEGDDTITGTGGDDVLDGGDDDDLLDGGAGDDTLSGGDGTDTIAGGEGADLLDGGGDDDDITVGAGDTALGGSGDDEFFVDPTLGGTDPITVIGGEAGEDLTDPTNGDDGDVLDLRGLGPVEVVFDPTDPEAGTATFTNDAGQPVTITFSEIEQVLTDGPGPDGTVDGEETGEVMAPGYDDADGPTDGGGDIIDGPDGLDDDILGNGGDDTIDAGLGDDTVDGGGDDDLIDGNDGDDLLAGGVGTDTITGGEGDDTIDGGAGDDDIAVGGNDVAEGGSGDDVFTLDPSDTGPVQAQIDGGSDATDGNPDDLANGNAGDILDLSDRPEDLDVTFGTDPESGIVDGLDGDSLPDVIFDEIEKVETGSGDDVIDGTGSNGPIDVAGNEGDDTITGTGGDDVLDGGDDDDLLDGGAGDDTLSGGDGTDTIAGGEGADLLDGGGDDDDITVGAGDTALGGSGDDEFFVDPTLGGTDPITVIGGEAGEDLTDPTNGDDGDVLDLRGLGPVEVVFDPTDPEAGTATFTNDAGQPVTITFSEIEQVLTDGPGPDGTVDGEETGEVMAPGYDDADGPTDGGGDIIDGPDGLDDDILGNGGDDTIDAGLGDDTVDGGGDDDLIDGNDGDDLLAGGVGTDTITGGEGDDTIDGGAGDDDIAVGGNDVADGGNGDDVFTIDPSDTGPVQAQIDGGSDATDGNPDDLANGNAGDVLDLSDRPEDLTLVFSPNPETGIVNGLDNDTGSDILFDEIEKVETGSGDDVIDGTNADGPLDVDAGDGDDSLFGGDGGDDLSGGDGDDLIDGGSDDDMLDGGDDNDTISGGGGDDTIMGGAGDDDILVDEGDFAMGGAGDDEFFVDPNGNGQTSVRIVGGEDDEEDVFDPTNNPGGRIGDVLDLRDVEVVSIAYDPTDPTFDPNTGVGESGVVTYLNGGNQPVILEFSEIENVLLPDPGNSNPIARADSANTNEGIAVTTNVLFNDIDPDGDTLTVTGATLTDPALGTVSFTPQGEVTFTPAAGVTGPVEIDYTVDDGNGGTDEAVLTVDVQSTGGGNTDPVAVDDTLGVAGDETADIDVLANDTDADGDTLSIIAIEGVAVDLGDVVELASGAKVTLNPDGTLTYDTNGAFDDVLVGTDETDVFDYTASDGLGGEAQGSVDVNICGATNTLDTIAERVVPDTATFTVTKLGRADYELTLDEAGVALDGVYDKAYCVDFDAPITALRTGAEVNAELDVVGADQVDYVSPGLNQYSPELDEDLDNIGWILNEDFGAQGYTETEIQAAMWGITNLTAGDVLKGGYSLSDDLTAVEKAGLTPSKLVETIGRAKDGSTLDNALEIYERALIEGEGYEAESGDDIVALLLTPDGADNNVQPFVIGVEFDELEEEPDCLL